MKASEFVKEIYSHFRWITIDPDGTICVHENKPEFNDDCYWTSENVSIVNDFIIIDWDFEKSNHKIIRE